MAEAQAVESWSAAAAGEAALPRQQGMGRVQVADKQKSGWSSALMLVGVLFSDGRTCRRALGLLASMLLVLVLESWCIVRISEGHKKTMTALAERQLRKFYDGLRQSTLRIAAILPVVGVHTLVEIALGTEWRSAITRLLAKKYLAGGSRRQETDSSGNRDDDEEGGVAAFYKLSMAGATDGRLDNPDQRLCQDVKDFVANGISLAGEVLGSLLYFLGFVRILYRVSPVGCALTCLYGLLGTSGALLSFAPRIFGLTSSIVQQEASLRYSLVRVRENAESVAFFKGGPRECAHFQHLFGRLTATVYSRIYQMVGFTMFSQGAKHMTFPMPLLILGPRYMRGEGELGELSQTKFAFDTVLDALLKLMEKIPDFSNLGAQASRLGALHESILETEAMVVGREEGENTSIALKLQAEGAKEAREEEARAAVVLEVNALTLKTPLPSVDGGSESSQLRQQLLLKGLSFQLQHGQSLLLLGESGIGKSSLLRAIAGLWSDGSGSVRRRGGRAVFFMPQRPYMCLGTLREQLLYPGPRSEDDAVREEAEGEDVSGERMQEALEEVGLGYLITRHGGFDGGMTEDWASVLSLGEQQRINFARALLQPDRLELALLDEGTSACDPESEVRLYSALQRRVRSYVSVGHRATLRRFHTHALLFERNGEGVRGSVAAMKDAGESPATCSYLSMEELNNLGLAL